MVLEIGPKKATYRRRGARPRRVFGHAVGEDRHEVVVWGHGLPEDDIERIKCG